MYIKGRIREEASSMNAFFVFGSHAFSMCDAMCLPIYCVISIDACVHAYDMRLMNGCGV